MVIKRSSVTTDRYDRYDDRYDRYFNWHAPGVGGYALASALRACVGVGGYAICPDA